MDITQIIQQLTEERDRINTAIVALRATTRRPGRPAGGKRWYMSAEARRRIGLAMKKCWAERKKGTK